MNKAFLYDWFGYNKAIFNYLHHFTDNYFIISILKFFTNYIGNYTAFPAHFCLLVIIAYKLSHKKDKPLEEEIIYIKSILVMLSSLMLIVTIGTLIKSGFDFTRPYCSADIELNSAISSKMHYSGSKCLQSLPSGHTLYTVTFIASIWPVLNKAFKIIGSATIISVMLSRVVLGFHFPADVVYGALLAISLTLISKGIIKHIVIKPTLTKLKDYLYL